MRLRRKRNLIPRLAACAQVLCETPEALRGAWRETYGKAALHIELGCGKGRFTCETAAARQDTLLVALERIPDAMVVAAERAVAAGLLNVRFLARDARGLAALFAPGEAERLYINFCDPWPSRRHADRRLTAPGFLALYRAVLSPGGELHFKTDNAPLFAYSLQTLTDCGFTLSEVTEDLHGDFPRGVMTDYEAKFHAQGIKICRCVARA